MGGMTAERRIHYTNWRMILPWAHARGGQTTGQDDCVWVMDERLLKALEDVDSAIAIPRAARQVLRALRT